MINNENNLEQKTGFKALVMRQIDRCLASIGTAYFNEYVEGLLPILPIENYEKILDLEDDWAPVTEKYVIRTNLGIDLGSKSRPLIWNDTHTKLGYDGQLGFSLKKIDGEIDWDDPNIYSPIKEEQRKTEYKLLLRLIMDEFEYTSMSYIPKKISNTR